MIKKDVVLEKARTFIYRNARPLDLARWQYHFENGTQSAVLTALAAYQNADGGFGSALEADCFNPDSAPVQTWCATEILREIGFEDSAHPIICGILRYLDSGADFSEEHNQWRNVVKTNNAHPHAVWWEYREGGDEFRYNPTACLAGFIIRFADRDSVLYKKARKIVGQAFDWFTECVPFEEAHITGCFIRLYEYLLKSGADIVDMAQFKARLQEQVEANICRDTEKWGREYVALPSGFILSKDSMFYDANSELIEKECDLVIERQLGDGSYAVPWQWCTDYKEFILAENWWKSSIVINNMRLLKEFG